MIDTFTKKKLPDVVIVSTGRAASTSLFNYIYEAMGENTPNNKEPHYFVDVNKFDVVPEILDEVYISEYSNYSELYRANKISVDASVGYFFILMNLLKI